MNSFAFVARILLASVLLVVVGTAAAQQDYPSKPIRIVVPYASGGGTDLITRVIGQRMSESWAQQVVVDNRPGGNGIIAGEILTKAAPDGYTVLLITGGYTVNPALFKKIPFDTLKAFDAVTLLARSPIILSAHPALGVASLGELVALAKAKPGQVSFASFGYGAMSHLAGEQLKLAARIDLLNVPYKGAGEAINNLLGGQVNLMFSSPAAVLSHFNAGKLKPLAVTSAARARAAPDIPTFAELGYPQVDADNWYGLAVPAGTPKPVIFKLHAEMARILRMPDVIATLAKSLDAEPAGTSPEQFRSFLQTEIEHWTNLVRAAKLQQQD
jgi:tripartite-type tricarboxylate transporter receptor subunit TctC